MSTRPCVHVSPSYLKNVFLIFFIKSSPKVKHDLT